MLDVGPAADVFERLLATPVTEDFPGDRRVLVLRDPRPARALGAVGDQVGEAQAHLRPVTDRNLGEPIKRVAGEMGRQVEAVGAREEVLRVAAVVGDVEGGAGRLRHALLAVQRQDVAERGAAQAEFQVALSQQRIVRPVDDVLVLEPKSDPEGRAGGELEVYRGGVRGRTRLCADSRMDVPTDRTGPAVMAPSTSSAQIRRTARSRQRCSSSSEAIMSPTACIPEGPAPSTKTVAGTACPAAREFETHPSTRNVMSSADRIAADAPSYRSR